ncbi:MAG: DUF2220 family protein [Gallionella sp.]|nr:DUF2220 family protein [Gallionella sp.]
MSDALEIASLGRLVETGLIKLVGRNDQLLRRFETARWIEPTGRKNEWRVRSSSIASLEARLNELTPSWREDFQFLLSIERDPYDPSAIEALPALKRQKTVTGMLNRRNWNAAAGLGPKHEPQIAPTATLTRDWVLRFRPNNGLRGVFDDKEVDFHEMAEGLTECVVPERMWLRFKELSGKLPKLAVTCENLGAYVDLPLPETVMAIYSPGADIDAAAALIKRLPEVQWIHFGDIDPDGLEIGESLAKEIGRKLNLYIPSFAEEYLPGRPVKRPWHKSPDSSLFKELRRTQKRIFQEVFMLDPRLGQEIDAMLSVIPEHLHSFNPRQASSVGLISGRQTLSGGILEIPLNLGD